MIEQVTSLIQKLCNMDTMLLDIDQNTQNQIIKKYQEQTKQLDQLDYNLLSEICAYMITINPDLQYLAGRILVEEQIKQGNNKIKLKMNDIYNQKCIQWKDKIEELRKQYFNKNYTFDFFAMRTLQRGYMIENELPVDMILRVSVEISEDIPSLINNVHNMCNKYYIHASPTLFNSGLEKPQLSSCFLVMMHSDSIKGIYKTLADCAQISKYGGGIAVSISNIRCQGSIVQSTGGQSQGIIQMLRVFNETCKYVTQSQRRKGSIAIYLEPWHGDIISFLQIRKTHGDPNQRCFDLFPSIYMNDLFMKRVENNEIWSLFCPSQAPMLFETYGEEFEKYYLQYEQEKKYISQISARKIFDDIIQSQLETGLPYLVYKDQCNRASNQKNLGTIKSSNLCVSGDTLVLTDQGHIPIKQLQDKKVFVWNGNRFSNTTVRKTNKKAKILKIKTNDFNYIDCTEYHKFKVLFNDKILEIESKNLLEGIELYKQDIPTTDLYDPKESDKLFQFNVYQSKNLEELQQLRLNYQLIGQQTIIKNVKNDIYQIEKVSDKEWRNFKLKVTEIIDDNVFSDTYCFAEQYQNQGVFNGILTKQCVEIVQHTNQDEIAVCNLACINLSKYVENFKQKDCSPKFNFELLGQNTKQLVKNLDNIIDVNFYPGQECKNSNTKHRPMSIGVQGLANCFIKMKYSYESKEARELNLQIFETIQFNALQQSMELAKEKGKYSSFEGSPASQGILQHDFYTNGQQLLSNRYNWEELKDNIKQYGLRNSLLTGCMPTQSVSQILNNTESFEPYNSNIFNRRTLHGEFICVNKYLIRDLQNLGLYNEDMKNRLIVENGSVQNIQNVPDNLKKLYKTIWEIPQKCLVDLSADRQRFIDQSQSLNIFMVNPNKQKLQSLHFYTWKNQLKSGLYYLRQLVIGSVNYADTEQKQKEKQKLQSQNGQYFCEGCQ